MRQPKDLVDRSTKGWNSRDFNLWSADFTDDTVLTGPGGLWGSGPEMQRIFYAIWQDGFPDNQVTNIRIVGDGNSALLEAVFEGTHTGVLAAPSGDIAPTDKPVVIPFVVPTPATAAGSPGSVSTSTRWISSPSSASDYVVATTSTSSGHDPFQRRRGLHRPAHGAGRHGCAPDPPFPRGGRTALRRRLCPDIPPPLELPPEQERRYLFNSIGEVLARTARAQPVLLVLDDLHWADEPTMLLVEHLAERIGDVPVLMVGHYRDSELRPRPR